MKDELIFYNEYERFYKMAEISEAFSLFCTEAFGADLSQDGFSDVSQLNRIFGFIPQGRNVHILDVGCGNGGLLRYIKSRADVNIHGFDYSEAAVSSAVRRGMDDITVGVIGEREYPDSMFDMVISMDSVYFAPDMTCFVSQVKRWLKSDGVFFLGYQEGDVIPKTCGINDAQIVKALNANGMRWEYEDITEETYHLLKRKRIAAEKYRSMFEAEGNTEWYDMLMWQTAYIENGLDKFKENMARYIITAIK